MPTQRQRYQITETDELARAIDLAAQRWPDASRAQRATLLIQAGAEAISTEQQQERQRRLDAIARTSGAFHYPPGYLDDLRSDWPE